MGKTKRINIFDQTKRQVRCITNKHDYLGTGEIWCERELTKDELYTIKRIEQAAYGDMLFLEEVESKCGFHSYLFEELQENDEEALRSAYQDRILAMLAHSRESIRTGRVFDAKQALKEMRERYFGRKRTKEDLKKIRVQFWMGWQEADEEERGSVFCVGPDAEYYYRKAIIDCIRKHNYKISGMQHQNYEYGAPVFSDGRAYLCSMRMWGEIMAEACGQKGKMDYLKWACESEESNLPIPDDWKPHASHT